MAPDLEDKHQTMINMMKFLQSLSILEKFMVRSSISATSVITVQIKGEVFGDLTVTNSFYGW